MKNFGHLCFSIVLASLAMGAGNSAAQVALNPGDVATAGFAVSTNPNDTFVASVDVLAISFVNAPTDPFFNGRIASVVFTDSANPYGGASVLSFLYQLENRTISSEAISRMALSGFGGYSTTVYSTDAIGGGFQPYSVDRSADGSTLGVNYSSTPGSGLPPSTFAESFVVYTNATSYGLNVASFSNSAVASVDVYSPAPIPEPEVYAMLGMGLGLLGWARRRKGGRLLFDQYRL